ncbi:MAG: c-type cytochrome [Dehalococcoidia bacterium]
MAKLRRRTFLILGLIIGTIAIACGGGGEEAPPTSTSTSVPTPAPTPTSAATPTSVAPTPTSAAPTPTSTPVEAALPGDPETGRQLFISGGCIVCHTISNIPEATGTIGPSQDDVATRAATRVEGLSAEEYIRQSILDPNAFVVEGFPANVMPQIYDTLFSEEELNDLVAFLLTLE